MTSIRPLEGSHENSTGLGFVDFGPGSKPCLLESVYCPSVYYPHFDTLLYHYFNIMTDLTYVHPNWEHLTSCSIRARDLTCSIARCEDAQNTFDSGTIAAKSTDCIDRAMQPASERGQAYDRCEIGGNPGMVRAALNGATALVHLFGISAWL